MFGQAYGNAYADNPTLKITKGTTYCLLFFGEDGIAQIENDGGDYVIVHDSWFDFDYQV